MKDPRLQIADVNHYDNTVVVKFEDGTVSLLNGSLVRAHVDAQDVSGMEAMPSVGTVDFGKKPHEE